MRGKKEKDLSSPAAVAVAAATAAFLPPPPTKSANPGPSEIFFFNSSTLSDFGSSEAASKGRVAPEIPRERGEDVMAARTGRLSPTNVICGSMSVTERRYEILSRRSGPEVAQKWRRSGRKKEELICGIRTLQKQDSAETGPCRNRRRISILVGWRNVAEKMGTGMTTWAYACVSASFSLHLIVSAPSLSQISVLYLVFVLREGRVVRAEDTKKGERKRTPVTAEFDRGGATQQSRGCQKTMDPSPAHYAWRQWMNLSRRSSPASADTR